MNLHTSQFGQSGKCVKTLCLAGGLLVFGLLDFFFRKQENRLTLLWGPPSPHQVFSLVAQLQVVPKRHCASRGFTKEVFFERLNGAFLEPFPPVSRCLDTWKMQSGRPMTGLDSPSLGDRIEECFATGILMVLAPGICNRSRHAIEGPSGVRGSVETATSGTWFSDLHFITAGP